MRTMQMRVDNGNIRKRYYEASFLSLMGKDSFQLAQGILRFPRLVFLPYLLNGRELLHLIA